MVLTCTVLHIYTSPFKVLKDKLDHLLHFKYVTIMLGCMSWTCNIFRISVLLTLSNAFFR